MSPWAKEPNRTLDGLTFMRGRSDEPLGEGAQPHTGWFDVYARQAKEPNRTLDGLTFKRGGSDERLREEAQPPN